MTHVGFAGSAFYTLSLSIYYVAIIKFNKKEKDISNKLLEYILHIIPNGFAIISCMFLAVKRQYGPVPANHGCWIAIHPRNCLHDPDVECERGGPMIFEYAKWFFVIPFMVIYVLVFCAMVIVCHHIIKQKRKADRWRMQRQGRDLSKLRCSFSQRQILRGAIQESTDEPVASISQAPQNKFLKMQQALRKTPNAPVDNTTILSGANSSRSGTSQDPLAFNVHQVKKKIRRESFLAHNAPIILSSDTSQNKSLRASRDSKSRRELASRDEKMAVTHCILYLSSFLLCYIFPLIAIIYAIRNKGSPAPFELVLFGRIFAPLQGIFFIFVYTRPHVKAIKNSNSELNWFQAFFIAFKAGGDNDFGDGHLELVDDEEGIDAPRLPDSERVRRQEIVRQQFQRKSVSYKPTYNSSLVHIEGNNQDVSDINDAMLVDGTMRETSHAKNDLVKAIMKVKEDYDEVDEIEV